MSPASISIFFSVFALLKMIPGLSLQSLPALSNMDRSVAHPDILSAVMTTRSSPLPTSISTLLDQPGEFHEQLIRVRGVIKQPELHLDETHLKENFVFRLTEGERFLTVFGTHDRTQGAPAISMNQQVEVVGIFYRERTLNTYDLSNLIEAFTVKPFPSLEPNES